MSYLNCPGCGLAILVSATHPLTDACPRCRCRCPSPNIAPGRQPPTSDDRCAAANIATTRSGREPGMDRLLNALRDDRQLAADRFSAGLRSVLAPRSGTAA